MVEHIFFHTRKFPIFHQKHAYFSEFWLDTNINLLLSLIFFSNYQSSTRSMILNIIHLQCQYRDGWWSLFCHQLETAPNNLVAALDTYHAFKPILISFSIKAIPVAYCYGGYWRFLPRGLFEKQRRIGLMYFVLRKNIY